MAAPFLREWSRLSVLVVTMFVLSGQAQAEKWEIVIQNAGVCAMHATLQSSNRVIFFDRTDFGLSNITFPDGYCRDNPRDLKLKHDCSAHSMALDLDSDTVQCLKVFSNPFCSSGAHRADGSLYQTGGWNDGSNVTRTIGPGPNDDWVENSNAIDSPNALSASRWYSTACILPDNRVIIVGGRRTMSYEFQPRGNGEKSIKLPFLLDTFTPGSELNLYPFVILNTDGNLFIFANQDSILFDFKQNAVIRKYPRIPDGPRTYPGTGSAVLLPLTSSNNYTKSEVLICGGAQANASKDLGQNIYDVTLQTCGRMVLTSPNPQWRMVNMPMPRVMGDLLLLPTGDCLIINGAGKGLAGWTSAKEPVFTPVTFEPHRNRFVTRTPSTIARMYHSVALVLPDGKILVAGGNPNPGYSFQKVEFPTELRIEKYSPYYLDKRYDARRPQVVEAPNVVNYGGNFNVSFSLSQAPQGVEFHLYAPPFATHTNSMSQRMLVLKFDAVVAAATSVFSATVYAPPSAVVAPAGFYLLTVVNRGTPSPSVWVQISF